VFALAEAIPNILADTHAELCRVAAPVDRAWAVQAVAAALELVEQAIVFKHLLHSNGRFNGLEVNKR